MNEKLKDLSIADLKALLELYSNKLKQAKYDDAYDKLKLKISIINKELNERCNQIFEL